MPNENGVYYEGPITIYFAKSLMLPDDTTGELTPRQTLTIENGKVFRNDDPKILSIISQEGSLFHFNFSEVMFFILHAWEDIET